MESAMREKSDHFENFKNARIMNKNYQRGLRIRFFDDS